MWGSANSEKMDTSGGKACYNSYILGLFDGIVGKFICINFSSPVLLCVRGNNIIQFPFSLSDKLSQWEALEEYER